MNEDDFGGVSDRKLSKKVGGKASGGTKRGFERSRSLLYVMKEYTKEKAYVERGPRLCKRLLHRWSQVVRSVASVACCCGRDMDTHGHARTDQGQECTEGRKRKSSSGASLTRCEMRAGHGSARLQRNLEWI